jgi:hypothetical protein
VSPRRNLRRDDATPLDENRVRRGVVSVQQYADSEWMVRSVPGGSTTKTYRCPGCDQEIRPGVGHVVAWPAEGWGDPGDRRHWHTACWQARDRRRSRG